MEPTITTPEEALQQYTEELDERDVLRDSLLYLATQNFYVYVRLMAPTIIPKFTDGRHIKVICDALQDFYENPDNNRLMLFLPPRSMKSQLASLLYLSWCFGRDPSYQILHVTYGSDFTAEWGGKVRDLLHTEEYLAIFPNTRHNEAYAAREYWETTAKGIYRAAGAGTNIAGKGGNLAVVDDIVTEQTAKSKAQMEKLYEWWPWGLESRLLPGGKILVINTRWSTMDISAWLLERASNGLNLDQWKVVSIPAILDEKASELLGLPEGTSYWPEFRTTEELLKTKRGMPNSQWLSVYMQTPIALDGNIIKTEKFKQWTTKTAEVDYVIASLDTAFSTNSTADYSVIQIWGVFTEHRVDSQGQMNKVPCIVLIDMVKSRLEYPDLLQKCAEMKKDYEPDVWVIEKKASGQSLIQDLRRRGYFVMEFMPDKDKVTRVVACTPFIEDQRLYLPENVIWAQNFKDSCAAFPKGTHDDDVDAMSQAILYLRDHYYLTYDEEESLEDLEDARQSRMAGKRYYW